LRHSASSPSPKAEENLRLGSKQRNRHASKSGDYGVLAAAARASFESSVKQLDRETRADPNLAGISGYRNGKDSNKSAAEFDAILSDGFKD
jgi:hypothetical protein